MLRKMLSGINGATISCLLFFILYYLYLWQAVDLRLVYHNAGSVLDYPIFYTGWEFFRKFTSYPGGLIAYVSAFLGQFLSIGWGGALIAILILHFPVPFGIHLFIFWVYRDYYTIANTKIRFC